MLVFYVHMFALTVMFPGHKLICNLNSVAFDLFAFNSSYGPPVLATPAEASGGMSSGRPSPQVGPERGGDLTGWSLGSSQRLCASPL